MTVFTLFHRLKLSVGKVELPISMECLLATTYAPAAASLLRSSLTFASKTKKRGCLRAKLGDEHDAFPQDAITEAALRFQETNRPDPLFFDPFAGCFVPPDIQMVMKKSSHHYCLATRFIDDRLLHTAINSDGFKQIVMLTDGMDARPYRILWPCSTALFDISPEKIFEKSSQEFKDAGAKIPTDCMFQHVSFESPDLQQSLHEKGFNGNRPSIWAIQGLPLMTLVSFKEILLLVGSLATKGCLFLGELPTWLADTGIGIKSRSESRIREWVDNLFSGHGFQVQVVNHANYARSIGRELRPGSYEKILFVAEQLRYSDDQFDSWKREVLRAEDEGDEEGFEDL